MLFVSGNVLQGFIIRTLFLIHVVNDVTVTYCRNIPNNTDENVTQPTVQIYSEADRCIQCVLSSGQDFGKTAFIRRPPKTYVALKEATAIFECIPSVFNISSDDVTVTWTIPFSVPVTRYNKLHSDDATGAFITPNSSILIMKNIQPEFAGIYQCVVETSDSTLIAEMDFSVRIYVIDMYRFLIAGVPAFLLSSMCIVIGISCWKLEQSRRAFYRARVELKQQQVLYKY